MEATNTPRRAARARSTMGLAGGRQSGALAQVCTGCGSRPTHLREAARALKVEHGSGLRGQLDDLKAKVAAERDAEARAKPRACAPHPSSGIKRAADDVAVQVRAEFLEGLSGWNRLPPPQTPIWTNYNASAEKQPLRDARKQL